MQTLPLCEPEQAQVGRQLLDLMLSGQSYAKAIAQLAVPAPFKQSRAYQLAGLARSSGQLTFQDNRHGHPSKFRPEITAWLQQLCLLSPLLTSRQLQIRLLEQFNLPVSLSQINRIRLKLGVANSSASRKLQGAAKKKPV